MYKHSDQLSCVVRDPEANRSCNHIKPLSTFGVTKVRGSNLLMFEMKTCGMRSFLSRSFLSGLLAWRSVELNLTTLRVLVLVTKVQSMRLTLALLD